MWTRERVENFIAYKDESGLRQLNFYPDAVGTASCWQFTVNPQIGFCGPYGYGRTPAEAKKNWAKEAVNASAVMRKILLINSVAV